MGKDREYHFCVDDGWEDKDFSCVQCGWKGKGKDTETLEIFHDLKELGCPECLNRIGLVEFITRKAKEEELNRMKSS